EQLEFAGRVLVGEHREDADEAPEGELLLERTHGRGHAMRVVRGVQQDRRRAAYPLEPTGRGRLGEAFANEVELQALAVRTAEDRLDRDQREYGVLRLVCAVDRGEYLVVHAAQSLQRDHLTADRG